MHNVSRRSRSRKDDFVNDIEKPNLQDLLRRSRKSERDHPAFACFGLLFILTLNNKHIANRLNTNWLAKPWCSIAINAGVSRVENTSEVTRRKAALGNNIKAQLLPLRGDVFAGINGIPFIVLVKRDIIKVTNS